MQRHPFDGMTFDGMSMTTKVTVRQSESQTRELLTQEIGSRLNVKGRPGSHHKSQLYYSVDVDLHHFEKVLPHCL